MVYTRIRISSNHSFNQQQQQFSQPEVYIVHLDFLKFISLKYVFKAFCSVYGSNSPLPPKT